MKILFLNLWHSKLGGPLKQWLEDQKDVDVFCFQEASSTDEILPEFLSEYQKRVATKHVAERVSYSQAMYVHPRWSVEETVELMQADSETGIALGLMIRHVDTVVTVLNVHGVARAFCDGVWQDQDDKRDFPARVRQSQAILEFAQSRNHPVILGGDFNVAPDTEAIEIFRKALYQDLIQKHAIVTTRNRFSWDKYPTRYLYSDYVFVSSILRVKSFIVPEVEVSDHLPMILEI